MIVSTFIKVERFVHGGFQSLAGPPTIILPISEAVKHLRQSGFMDRWIEERIAEELANGHKFVNSLKSADDEKEDVQIKSRYSLANDEDIARYSSAISSSALSPDSKAKRGKFRKSRRSDGRFKIGRGSDPSKLPRQARVIVGVLASFNGDVITEKGLVALLEKQDNVEALKTKQKPESIYRFYKNRLIEEGFLLEE